MLKNALDMFSAHTPEDLITARSRWLRDNGLKERRYDDLPSINAYVSDSRWVADCPECNGGIAVLPSDSEAVCLDCGLVVTVVVPSERDRTKADLILTERPPQARNWYAHRGETLRDLREENMVRGVRVPPEAM